MAKTKISVRIPEQLGKQVENMARIGGCSKASILVDALENYIERHFPSQERPQDQL
ncbi:hypothetical protein [Aestuariivirga sp.]|uniref:hypothetical protein n=1 Tax=Aestuariivirga sp. TaxID=2650926 RepID=UPI0039E2EFC6